MILSKIKLIEKHREIPDIYFITNFDNGCCVEVDLDGTIYLHFNLDNSNMLYDTLIKELNKHFEQNYQNGSNICYEEDAINIGIDEENEIELCIICENFTMLDEILRKNHGTLRTIQFLKFLQKEFDLFLIGLI